MQAIEMFVTIRNAVPKPGRAMENSVEAVTTMDERILSSYDYCDG
jgi:ketosteroid isomerase-like protein